MVFIILCGAFTAVLSMKLIQNGYNPKIQVLIYPALQLFDFMLPSYRQPFCQIAIVKMSDVISSYLNTTVSDNDLLSNNHTTPEVKRSLAKYVPYDYIPAKYRQGINPLEPVYGDAEIYLRVKLIFSPDISPLLVEDKVLKLMPITYILSVGHDRFRDEAFIYEKRLEVNGVQVTHHHYEHSFHGALQMLNGVASLNIANEMMEQITDFLLKMA
ncbi:unnamed protein product [Didymodactylos carnosus]|uniref:Alpha/beta hydrolase fold-3 domain-containing protein n=1 Tax=Didymodactylos carnosus TaxID=1234261 RepID=A0A813WW21_9BILA|nr:unnamed protein product [Didymodactylos carnosus]CAF0856313.1 unnamed protein product [Didymodactylos carnosus]CAF3585892.1 unnamed protein product [Didymodactylos carnosus]CAF3644074.1 unnamed protein product [Didymodactylos carnosus]